jgi:3-methylfumaryl-CoA hydratase
MRFSEADYQDWIGRRSERQEVITPRLIAHFVATLGALVEDRPVPLGLFWALAPEALGKEQLGRDGHPRTGINLPALPLPRRMWAGGALRILGEFEPGDEVKRSSVIEKITRKEGASGPLGFVTLRHHYSARGRTIIEERQDIAYREDPKPGALAPAPPAAPDVGPPHAAIELTPDPLLLFRYSALTFNGHRIHYDHPYATTVEGYEGLVVHGPLQATLTLNLATRVFGRPPARFSYRGVSPLICGRPIRVEAHGHDDEADGLALRVRVQDGPVTMTAQAFR